MIWLTNFHFFPLKGGLPAALTFGAHCHGDGAVASQWVVQGDAARGVFHTFWSHGPGLMAFPLKSLPNVCLGPSLSLSLSLPPSLSLSLSLSLCLSLCLSPSPGLHLLSFTVAWEVKLLYVCDARCHLLLCFMSLTWPLCWMACELCFVSVCLDCICLCLYVYLLTVIIIGKRSQ